MVNYISTRGKAPSQDFVGALLNGLAVDGGLYLPDVWPQITLNQKPSITGCSYAETAHQVTQPFIGDTISADVMLRILNEVYDQSFSHSAVAPLVQIDTNKWVLELFYGPTLAFKDYALQLLGHLFDHVLGERGERVTIVGATSGDTGSAAIEACKGCKNIDIFILHPEGRTSEVQRRQMTTIDAPNVYNIALQGTFDDCQNIVKAMFGDEKFRNDVRLSAVNSINWARIMAQIVYYFTAASSLGDLQRSVSFAVPTGNFGNVFAAYCAKKMGLPVERLIIGSNRNDILTRFFETGVMKTGAVEPSLSPSMDIQISSNFERFLFDFLDRDAERVAGLMQQFKEEGEFSLSGAEMDRARTEFEAYRCDDQQTKRIMPQCYADTGYILDPHTAVGMHAASQSNSDELAPIIALACAHPAKFPDAVHEAIGMRPELPPHLEDLYDRSEFVTSLDNNLETVQDFVRQNIRK